MEADDMEFDITCPHCGESVLENDPSGEGYWCPSCGAQFDREDIEEAVEFDEDNR